MGFLSSLSLFSSSLLLSFWLELEDRRACAPWPGPARLARVLFSVRAGSGRSGPGRAGETTCVCSEGGGCTKVQTHVNSARGINNLLTAGEEEEEEEEEEEGVEEEEEGVEGRGGRKIN